MKALDSEAKKCFESDSLDQAIQYCNKALEICQTFNFEMEGASLHNSLAELCLSKDQYEDAYAHADICISTLKSKGQVIITKYQCM